MHPGDDPALAARFLGWLQARHATGTHLAGDVLRLTEFGAWGLSALQASALPFDPDDRDRLLELHARWLSFASEIPAEWAEIGGDHDEVVWVDPVRDAARRAPEGEAPRLASSPVDTPVPPRRPRRSARLDLGPLLGIAVALVVMGGVEHRARTALRSEISNGGEAVAQNWALTRAERHHRLATQAFVADKMLDLCLRRRAAVSRHCEGGPWCEERLRALDHRARTLAALLEAAGPPPVPLAQASRPPAAVLEAHAALLAELAAGFEGTVPVSASVHEQEHRARVVAAELAVVAAEIGGP